MQKILIIQTAFIGDVVLATGVLEKLHTIYPAAKIDFLLRKGNEGLLSGHPFLNKVLIWDKKGAKYQNLWKILGQIRKEKYDLVVNLQRFAASGILTGFSGATLKYGYEKNPFSFLFTKSFPHPIGKKGDSSFQHETERNHALIKDFTDSIASRPRLYPALSDFDIVSPYKTQPYITISPASVWFTKQYPKEKWVALINTVPEQYTIFLTGGSGDKALCDLIKDASQNQNLINLAGKLSFLQTAALMKDAYMNYTNDSAPMHFASAMNASVTAVYCSTVPEFGFGPLSDVRRIAQISYDLDCRPCGLHGYNTCPKGHFKCAVDLDMTFEN